MQRKLLNFGLILSSLVGYLEWGTDQSQLLFQMELELISKLFTDPASALHPFTVIPLLGQLLLVITLFQKQASKTLTYLGISFIAILLVFIFAIGISSQNWKIALSGLPFIVLSITQLRFLRKH